MVPIQRAGARVEFEMHLPWKTKENNSIQFTASEIASFKGVIHPENLIDFLQNLKNFEKTHKNSIDFSMETVWN